jgi:hypothetical protein
VLDNGTWDEFEPYQGFFDLFLRICRKEGLGAQLLGFLAVKGLHDKYWPFYCAFDAYVHGERRLLDVNPEVRRAARRIFNRLSFPDRLSLEKINL